jgi:hypothetical protein
LAHSGSDLRGRLIDILLVLLLCLCGLACTLRIEALNDTGLIFVRVIFYHLIAITIDELAEPREPPATIGVFSLSVAYNALVIVARQRPISDLDDRSIGYPNSFLRNIIARKVGDRVRASGNEKKGERKCEPDHASAHFSRA